MQENEIQKESYKRNYKQEENYKKRYSVVVTPKEGEILDKIISDNGCNNLSQLCKKIVHGEVTLY